MPTMGNDTPAGGADIFGDATLAGLFCRRAGKDFFFMRLFHALERGSFGCG